MNLAGSIRHFTVVIVAVALLVSSIALCTRSGLAAETKTVGTRLTEQDVVRIANAAAEKRGYRLRDFDTPRVHYESTKKDKTWTVFYNGKVLAFGNHFLVWVEDQTGLATVMLGE